MIAWGDELMGEGQMQCRMCYVGAWRVDNDGRSMVDGGTRWSMEGRWWMVAAFM